MSALGRFILWDYPRASWQYDLVVALILAFIFLTPRDVFRDQPKPASVAMINSERGEAYWIEPGLLVGVPEQDRVARATELVRSRFKEKLRIVRVEPILDEEEEIRGFFAYHAK